MLLTCLFPAVLQAWAHETDSKHGSCMHNQSSCAVCLVLYVADLPFKGLPGLRVIDILLSAAL
jgi:hypothetical protein